MKCLPIANYRDLQCQYARNVRELETLDAPSEYRARLADRAHNAAAHFRDLAEAAYVNALEAVHKGYIQVEPSVLFELDRQERIWRAREGDHRQVVIRWELSHE